MENRVNAAKVTTVPMGDVDTMIQKSLLIPKLATLRTISYVSELDSFGYLDSIAQRSFLLRTLFKANG